MRIMPQGSDRREAWRRIHHPSEYRSDNVSAPQRACHQTHVVQEAVPETGEDSSNDTREFRTRRGSQATTNSQATTAYESTTKSEGTTDSRETIESQEISADITRRLPERRTLWSESSQVHRNQHLPDIEVASGRHDGVDIHNASRAQQSYQNSEVHSGSLASEESSENDGHGNNYRSESWQSSSQASLVRVILDEPLRCLLT